MFRNLLLATWMVLCAGFAAFAQANGQGDLVINGGFENGTTGWQFQAHDADLSTLLDDTEHHSGQHAFKITNRSAWGANIYGRLFQVISHLQPYSTYRISCWARGKACGLNWFGGGPGWLTRHVFPTGDFDWQQVTFEVNTDANADNYELMVASESPTTALWVDDIQFQLVKVDEAKKNAVNQEINAQVRKLADRLDKLKGLSPGPYLQLGTAIVRRFLDFARTGGPNGRLSRSWVKLQLAEVVQVLDETERLAKANPTYLAWRPPAPGSVKLKNGTFFEGARPHYFAGYGHFSSVIDDLPIFPGLGASLVQDAQFGPSSMNPDGTLSDGAAAVTRDLDRASRFGMKEDFLLSPHYYPAWGNAPDLRNGNPGFLDFNIFHPKAKEVEQKWAEAVAAKIKDKPALLSVCLANEPVYHMSGRDVYTRPMFAEYLRQTHKTIARLNALYGTSYRNFDDVPVPPESMPPATPARRAYYDWTRFNNKMFADWHAWLNSILKRNGVKAPVHTKIMVFRALDRDKVSWGVDPELMCRATDIAGCDAYAFRIGSYDLDWFGDEFFYDLLHSFRGQTVFNSENHLLPDRTGHIHIPMSQIRSAIWQGGLHHQGATTIWVWQNDPDGELSGSIYFRPADIYGAGRAMLDLNRLAPEVTAINTARPRVALLFSQTSIFWEGKYGVSISSLYTALNFMGENATFVSERQLAEGAVPKVQCLIVPDVTHTPATTCAALAAYAKSGGKVLFVGKDCLRYDEYARPLHLSNSYPILELGKDDQSIATDLRQALLPFKLNDLQDAATGHPAWGVEFRVVKYGRKELVPLINFSPEVQTVRLADGRLTKAVDLLNDETVDLKAIRLEPMSPRLLRLEK